MLVHSTVNEDIELCQYFEDDKDDLRSYYITFDDILVHSSGLEQF